MPVQLHESQSASDPAVEGGVDGYLAALDARTSDLERWINRAADALLRFKIQAGFRRNTMPTGSGPGTTSTARSLFALYEFRNFLLEEGRPIPEAFETELKQSVGNWMFRMAKEGPEQMCKDSENQSNRFTYSHMLMALCFLPRLVPELGLDEEYGKIRPNLAEAGNELSGELRQEVERRGRLGLNPEDSAPQPFVTLHGVRAVDVAGGVIQDPSAIRTSASATVLEQLGYHAAGVMSRFDPGALVCATALLGRFKAEDRAQLTEHAVRVAREVQTDDGAWLSEQVVASSGESRIYVSSYEVGLGMTYLALRELAYGNVGLVQEILPSLEKVMDLIRASYISNDAPQERYKGWANDRSRWPKLIESWATASVLTFVLRYRMLLQGVSQHLVLARYGGITPRRRDEVSWPDLSLAYPGETGRVTRANIDDQLQRYTDPTKDRRLTEALTENILAPILDRPGNRPDKASLILYGPPGSRKTSLVKRMADALDWPIVILSPPNFLGEHGLDGFEGAAARIFNDLMRLRRAVVLFDECEDFFKPRRRYAIDGGVERDSVEGRSGDERPEARTIGAFLTAGMLPRLQRLRDHQWVIFVLATNIEELSELDEAVRRPGRFDYADKLRHPKLAAQTRYVTEHRRYAELDPEQTRSLQQALTDFQAEEEVEMPFAVIDYLVAGVLDEDWGDQTDDLIGRLRTRMEDVDKPPSLIGAED